jgi:hypothetical protein
MSVTSSTSASAFSPRARMALAASSFPLGARGERHMSTGRGQRRRGREPDAAAAAGNQRAPAVEAEGRTLGELDRRHGRYTFPFA